MSSSPLIAASGVGVRYGPVAALVDASISVHRGETWAIVGANGSGKSTLLRALARLEDRGGLGGGGHPSHATGSVTYASGGDLARQRAFVPQRPEVAAPFSAREVVRLGRYAQGPDEAAVERALGEVGLAHRAEMPFHELSGGERQRVAVARAFAQLHAGGVLFLDEPFSGVDPAEVARIAQALQRRAEAGAVVLSLHDPGLARAIATHAAILRAGRIDRMGPTHEVLRADALSEAYGHPMREVGGWIVPDLGICR